VIAQRQQHEPVSFPVAGFDGGSISMLCSAYRMRRDASRRIALVVIVALLVAVHYARQPSPRGSHSSAAPPAATGSAPEQLRVWHAARCTAAKIGRRGVGGVGTLDAFCLVHFDVPEDWDSPAGRHIQLRVAIVQQRRRAQRH
jgi:hypothetical protein